MNQKILLYISLALFVITITSLVVFFLIFQNMRGDDSPLSNLSKNDVKKETTIPDKSDNKDVADEKQFEGAKPKYDISVIDEPQVTDQKIPNEYELMQQCTLPGLNVPDNAVVYVAGGYSGKPVDFQIDDSGNSAGQIDVVVNHTQNPVILILGAYDPTIWNIMWTKNTNIIGVYVSGYERQVIAGLTRNVPTLINSYNNNEPCGESFYVDRDQLARINNVSQSMFQKDVSKAYLANEGEVVVGDGVERGVKVFTSNAHTPESFFDMNAPKAGQAGLDDALQKGIIRLATREDLYAWEKATAQNNPELIGDSGDDSYIESNLSMGRVYVVLKEFQYPAGLYGGNSAMFIIEKGVPRPTGDPGHSEIMDMNGNTCTGPGCYH